MKQSRNSPYIIAGAYALSMLVLLFSRVIAVTVVVITERAVPYLDLDFMIVSGLWVLMAICLLLAIVFGPIYFFEELNRLQLMQKRREVKQAVAYFALLALFIADYFLAGQAPLIFVEAGICKIFMLVGIVAYLIGLTRSISAAHSSNKQ